MTALVPAPSLEKAPPTVFVIHSGQAAGSRSGEVILSSGRVEEGWLDGLVLPSVIWTLPIKQSLIKPSMTNSSLTRRSGGAQLLDGLKQKIKRREKEMGRSREAVDRRWHKAQLDRRRKEAAADCLRSPPPPRALVSAWLCVRVRVHFCVCVCTCVRVCARVRGCAAVSVSACPCVHSCHPPFHPPASLLPPPPFP
jgi:hypothetical protein